MLRERKKAWLTGQVRYSTLLCARKIIDLVDAPDHEKMGKRHWLDVFEDEAIEHAAKLMEKIDERWPQIQK